MDSTAYDDPGLATNDLVLGWDLGGVHVKVAAVAQGRVKAVRQEPYQIRQGLAVLDGAFAALPAWAREARHHGLRTVLAGLDLP